MKLFSNLQEQVSANLRMRIVSGQIAPGTEFHEHELAEEFGVSRGPIRDTLLTLTKEGLLHARPNIGVRVAELASPFKRKVIVRLRREIENTALTTWFEHPDPVLLERLDTNLAAYKVACGGTDFPRVVELDMMFHRTLVESADGGSLVALWLPVILQMLVMYSRHRNNLMISHDEHAAIFAAMQDKDHEKASSLLVRHIA